MDKAAAAPFQLRHRRGRGHSGPKAGGGWCNFASASFRCECSSWWGVDRGLGRDRQAFVGNLHGQPGFSFDQSLKPIRLGPDLLGPFSDPSKRLASGNGSKRSAWST